MNVTRYTLGVIDRLAELRAAFDYISVEDDENGEWTYEGQVRMYISDMAGIRGLSVRSIERNSPELTRAFGFESDQELVDFLWACAWVLPNTQEKMAVIAAFGLTPRPPRPTLSALREKLEEHIGVSRSTLLRLEKAGADDVATVALWAASEGASMWESRIEELRTRHFSINKRVLTLWPRWFPTGPEPDDGPTEER